MNTLFPNPYPVAANDLILAALEDYTEAAQTMNALTEENETLFGSLYPGAAEAAFFAAQGAVFALIDAHCTAAVCRALEAQSLADITQETAAPSPIGDTLPTPEPLIARSAEERKEGLHKVNRKYAAKTKAKNGAE